MPFDLSKIELPYPEHEDAPPVIVCTPILQPIKDYHLFVQSDQLKELLLKDLSGYGQRPSPHPTALELFAAYYTITFHERSAKAHSYWEYSPRVIANDNWGRINWACIALFEAGNGYISRWEGRFLYSSEIPDDEPQYRVNDLILTRLTEDCGKSYATTKGEIVLEYVDRI